MGLLPCPPVRHVAKRPCLFHVKLTRSCTSPWTPPLSRWQDLSQFISMGRLSCSIDKVNGIVSSTRPDTKNAQYQATIKQGDLLLNRVQKLSRVTNI